MIPLDRVKKIIFVRSGNIGDLICITPSIALVKKLNPELRVSVLVNRYNYQIIEDNPCVDKIYIYDKYKHGYYKSRAETYINALRLFLKIRKERYDVAIGCSANYSKRIARMTFFTGGGWRAGYVPESGILPWIYYNIPVKQLPEGYHEVEYIFNIIKEIFNLKMGPGKLVLNVPEFERKRAENYLLQNGIKRNNIPLIAIHIGARKPKSRWPAERYSMLAEEIKKRFEANIILLWTPGDRKNPFYPGDDDKVEMIEKMTKVKIYKYYTKNIKELVGILRICDYLICCDSGALHIGAALDLPIVGLFSSDMKIKKWFPWKVKNRCIAKGNSVSNIDVEDVISALEDLMGRKS